MNQGDPVRQAYDHLAPAYDRRWRSYEDATLHATLEAVTCRAGDRFLDVACGTGELERLLRARYPGL